MELSLVVGREREELGSDERRLGLARSLKLDVSLEVAAQDGSAEIGVDSSDQVVDATVLGKELLVEVSPSVVKEVELVVRGLDGSTRGKEAEELGGKVDLGLAGSLLSGTGGILLLLLHLENISSLGRGSERTLELLAKDISDDPCIERLRGDRDLNLETGGGSDGQRSEKRAVTIAVAAAVAAAGGKLDV